MSGTIMALNEKYQHIRGELKRARARIEELEAALASPSPPKEAAQEWRCFHCDEVFKDREAAQEHFGRYECSDPACQIKKGDELNLVRALRRAEDERNDAWDAVHSEGIDAVKAMRGMAADHVHALRREEEKGYARGLRDAQEIDPPKKAAQDMVMREALADFVACFETFKGSLGKSTQGWDYPRLHRVREKAEAILAASPSAVDVPREGDGT